MFFTYFYVWFLYIGSTPFSFPNFHFYSWMGSYLVDPIRDLFSTRLSKLILQSQLCNYKFKGIHVKCACIHSTYEYWLKMLYRTYNQFESILNPFSKLAVGWWGREDIILSILLILDIVFMLLSERSIWHLSLNVREGCSCLCKVILLSFIIPLTLLTYFKFSLF